MLGLFSLLAEEFNCLISRLLASDWILKFARCYTNSNLNDSNWVSTHLAVEGNVHNAPQDTGRNLECLPEPCPKLPILVLYLHLLSKHDSLTEALYKSEIFTLQWKQGQIWENTNSSLRGGNNFTPLTTLLPTRTLRACSVFSKMAFNHLYQWRDILLKYHQECP